MPIPSLEVKSRAVQGEGGKKRLEVYAQCTLSKEPSGEIDHEASWVISGKRVPFQLEQGRLQYELKELEHGFKARTTVSLIDSSWGMLCFVQSNDLSAHLIIDSSTISIH